MDLTPNQRNGWTTHGHRIDGVPQIGAQPTKRARCGGPAMCEVCAAEASRVRERYDRDEVIAEVNRDVRADIASGAFGRPPDRR